MEVYGKLGIVIPKRYTAKRPRKRNHQGIFISLNESFAKMNSIPHQVAFIV